MPPPQSPLSPDGRMRWDGSAWVPNTPVAVVAAKNPGVSLIVSFFLPGVGSMINGDTGRGLLILGIWLLGLVLTLIWIGLLLTLGMWIWGMLDAYQGAVRWNAAHGIIS